MEAIFPKLRTSARFFIAQNFRIFSVILGNSWASKVFDLRGNKSNEWRSVRENCDRDNFMYQIIYFQIFKYVCDTWPAFIEESTQGNRDYTLENNSGAGMHPRFYQG